MNRDKQVENIEDKSGIYTKLNDNAVKEVDDMLSALNKYNTEYEFQNIPVMAEDVFVNEFISLFNGELEDEELPRRWISFAGSRTGKVRILRNDGTNYVMRGLIDSSVLDRETSERIQYSTLLNTIEKEMKRIPLAGLDLQQTTYESITSAILPENIYRKFVLYDSRLDYTINDGVKTDNVEQENFNEPDDDIEY